MSKEKELYRKYRPTNLKEVVGQDEAIETLRELAKGKSGIPHCLLFSGPAGCGKTTLARIIRERLKCSNNDFVELNCADFRGIEMVRDIRSRMELVPINGKSRVWLVDEAGRLTADAQNAFLKILEDTPSHVYFILCTTEPQKLLTTIKSRATQIQVKSVRDDVMGKLVQSIYKQETESVLSEEVVNKIVEVAEGGVRKALVLLNQVIGIDDEEKQLAVVDMGVEENKREAFELGKALLASKPSWSEIIKILKGIEKLDTQAESIRWLILSFMASVAVRSPKQAGRACEVISHFRDNFYDSKRAGLILALYDASGVGK